MTRGERLPRHVRLLLWRSRRELPAPVCGVTVERNIEVPAAAGVRLLTDHYWPHVAGPVPTLLVRSPYGRGLIWDYLYGALFARQGFHVILQSCRGTGGSGGVLDPLRHEAADAQATVAWLRDQDWFHGRLGTVGASYLGYTQWALAASPPPELKAMAVQVGSNDFSTFLFPGGAFALEATLTATAMMLSMERGLRPLLRALTRLAVRLRGAVRVLPLADAYPPVLGQRAGFFEDWLAHPDLGDPYWTPRRAPLATELDPPVSLLSGWRDPCLDATLAAYAQLRAAGRPARLVVGPWTHASAFTEDLPLVFGEALDWFRTHLDEGPGEPDRGPATSPVRVHVGTMGGPGRWRDLAAWPPETQDQPGYLHGDGTLASTPADQAAVSTFRYDPAEPTPSVGGPQMDARPARPRRNNALEARDDVLVFTGAPLREPLEVIGPVSLRLRVSASHPHFDVFARLCDVDTRGRSWDICDGLIRLGAQAQTETHDSAPADIVVPMGATAHRFSPGHRLRVQVSGGAHPRYLRNTGTSEPLASATRLVPVTIEITHGPDHPAVLSLPVIGP
ncbi:MAG TPA: CocE/NonD family hydrolase [Streptosporangiaceae bacterium]